MVRNIANTKYSGVIACPVPSIRTSYSNVWHVSVRHHVAYAPEIWIAQTQYVYLHCVY